MFKAHQIPNPKLLFNMFHFHWLMRWLLKNKMKEITHGHLVLFRNTLETWYPGS